MKNYQANARNILILMLKELKDAFTSPVAYIVISFFTIVVGIAFAKDIFVTSQADMRSVFNTASLVLVIVVPAITMRSFAEERQSGTYEILSTLPLSSLQILLAKFFANLFLCLVIILATLPIPIILNVIGQPNNGLIVAGYLGLFILSASYVALGQFISINSTSQVAAFLLTVTLIAILYVIGMDAFLQLLPQGMRSFFNALSLKSHFDGIAKGVIDTRDILYYFSILLLMFYFTFKSILRIKKKGL
ncbi:MAG: ABC transporter permease [bacterium]